MLIPLPLRQAQAILSSQSNLLQMAEMDPTPETPRTPLDKVQQFYNSLVEKAKAASPLHRRGGSNGRNAFRADTPTSAKEGNNTIQLTATAQP